MKALLFGCNGLLGQNVIATAPKEWALVGSDIKPTAVKSGLYRYQSVDLLDRKSVQAFIQNEKPDLIINAAAYTLVDACEDNIDLAYRLNAGVVTDFVSSQVPVVHISTDFVFDGVAGPYTELDAPHPISIYGVSKLAAEPIALSSHPKSLVLRTCLLWGRGQGDKLSFVEWVRQQLSANKEIKCVTDQVGNPTLAADLAKVIWALVDKNVGGLYHVSGSERLSRFDWAVAIAKYYGLSTSGIHPSVTADLNQRAARPLSSGFILDKLKSVLGFVPGDLSSQFRDFETI